MQNPHRLIIAISLQATRIWVGGGGGEARHWHTVHKLLCVSSVSMDYVGSPHLSATLYVGNEQPPLNKYTSYYGTSESLQCNQSECTHGTHMAVISKLELVSGYAYLPQRIKWRQCSKLLGHQRYEQWHIWHQPDTSTAWRHQSKMLNLDSV